MSKTLKSKKDKVPKLTEEEYVKYISALKEGDNQRGQSQMQTASATPEKKQEELS